MTWRKVTGASSLNYLSKVSANRRHDFSIRVAGTRPPVVFLSLLFANWSSLFRTIRSRCLIMPLMFWWVAVRAHYEKNHTHWVQHHPDLLSPCLQQMELAQWIKEGRIGYRCLSGVKQTTKHKAYRLYTWFIVLVTAAGEILQT